ncbi:MAG: SoxR reducing system RseC family protein [Clostridia bacterium]|nr:SoxR reducing system RseC family protein [Clostridia bacterium]
MTQKGLVLSLDGEYATVRVMRTSACEGCKQKDLCAGISAGCPEGKPLDVVVKNCAGAAVGDNVLLTSPSGFVLGAAFCVFTAPIIIAVVVYFICAYLTHNVTLSYIVTALSFIISMLLFCFGLNAYTAKRQPVEISHIL